MRDVTDGSGVKVALLYTNAIRPGLQHATDSDQYLLALLQHKEGHVTNICPQHKEGHVTNICPQHKEGHVTNIW